MEEKLIVIMLWPRAVAVVIPVPACRIIIVVDKVRSKRVLLFYRVIVPDAGVDAHDWLPVLFLVFLLAPSLSSWTIDCGVAVIHLIFVEVLQWCPLVMPLNKLAPLLLTYQILTQR